MLGHRNILLEFVNLEFLMENYQFDEAEMKHSDFPKMQYFIPWKISNFQLFLLIQEKTKIQNFPPDGTSIFPCSKM